MEQLSRDVKFLRNLGLVDYSLLVGIQPTMNGNSTYDGGDCTAKAFSELVFRLKRSLKLILTSIHANYTLSNHTDKHPG